MNSKHIIITTIFLLLICSGTASATTYTVCASGCDYTTIQAAENVAAAGDTVYVYNGTYTENIVIANASVTFEGEGMDVVTVIASSTAHVFAVSANYVNITGFNITDPDPSGNSVGVYLGSRQHCNISYNTISNNRKGVWMSSSDNNVLTNNVINSNVDYGIWIYSSDYNTLTNNVIISNNCYGIWMYGANDNVLTNNVVNSNNDYGIYLSASHNNVLTDNTMSSNKDYGIYLSSSNNNVLTNSSISNNMKTVSCLQTDAQEGSVGNQIDFNFTMKTANITDCSTCIYEIILSPPESNIQHSKSGALVTGNFSPSREGIYSLRINVTDVGGNSEVRKYVYLINATSSTTIDYYFRHVLATHGQPTTYGTDHDAGSLLLDLATSDENVWCNGYIGFSIDVLPIYLFGTFKEINYSIWYKTDGDGYTGVQRYGDMDNTVDESIAISTTAKTFSSFNFPVDWTNDYFATWYYPTVKLQGTTPYIYSNATHPSYANMTYTYPMSPAIKSVSNEDISLFSATSNASDDTEAMIVLNGTGTTYFVIQMPNVTPTYTATWDDAACTGGDCSFTQSAGEINFTLTLGSEHTINISEASAGTNDITLAANTYGFLCEDPSIAHPFDMIAPEFDHEICFSWLNNSGECWESYWSGDAYNSDLSIPKNDAYFVLMDGAGETVSCGVRAAGNVWIPTGYYATYLGESTAKTLTQIKTDIQVDGDVTNLYTWDHNAGGTGAWVSVDVAPSHSVLPNQGILINNMDAGYNWDGTIS